MTGQAPFRAVAATAERRVATLSVPKDATVQVAVDYTFPASATADRMEGLPSQVLTFDVRLTLRGAARSELAQTGAGVGWASGLALVLIAAGWWLVVLRRRRNDGDVEVVEVTPPPVPRPPSFPPGGECDLSWCVVRGAWRGRPGVRSTRRWPAPRAPIPSRRWRTTQRAQQIARFGARGTGASRPRACICHEA